MALWTGNTGTQGPQKHPKPYSQVHRDLIGYGANPPKAQWPGGAYIAVNFVMNYEEGGEHTVLNGDKRSEVFLNEVPGGPPTENARNVNMETMYEYGSRAGFWRLLRLFDSRNIKVTVFAVGRALELNPEAAQAMVKGGHEVASHGYRWIDYAFVDEATERRDNQLAIQAIEKATGRKPRGWYTGRISENSWRLAFEAGDFLYNSDSYADDLPYWILDDNNKPQLILPYTLDVNDMKFSVPPGFTSPDGFFNYLKDCFDTLYEEGKDGTPKMMNIGLHNRLIGKPGRFKALERFVDYILSKEKVWITTREEIALHWRKVHPYTPKSKL